MVTADAGAREAEQERPPVTAIGKKVGKEFLDDDVPGLAAEIAYHLLFSIPAIVMLLIFLAALINDVSGVDVVSRLKEMVEDYAPADTQEILISLIDNAIAQMSGGLASFGVLITAALAIWSGSNGVAAIMKAFNRAYDQDEDRPFVKKKLTAIGLTLLLGLFVNLAFVLLVFGTRIAEWIADNAGLGRAFELAVAIGRWPVGFLLIAIMLAVLYYLGPNVEQSFRWLSPGSIVATALWIALIFGFSLYLRFADPGGAYGSLSSILVFIFFLYVSAIVLLIGAEVNAALERRFDPVTLEDIADEPARAAYGTGATPVSVPPGPAVMVPGYAAPPSAAYASYSSAPREAEEVAWRTAAVGLVSAAGFLILGRIARR